MVVAAVSIYIALEATLAQLSPHTCTIQHTLYVAACNSDKNRHGDSTEIGRITLQCCTQQSSAQEHCVATSFLFAKW